MSDFKFIKEKVKSNNYIFLPYALDIMFGSE